MRYSTDMKPDALDPDVVFGAPADPLRPQDLVPPPGPAAAVPPKCPTEDLFLAHVQSNAAGDAMFECLHCGYRAIYRVAGAWEPHPSERGTPAWRPPTVGAARRQAYRPPAPAAAPATEPAVAPSDPGAAAPAGCPYCHRPVKAGRKYCSPAHALAFARGQKRAKAP